MAMSGQRIPRRAHVHNISFSAHVDFQQNSDFIRELKPAHLVRAGDASTLLR
jgi:cleavage and polyadenylation specificity factor subunit 3